MKTWLLKHTLKKKTDCKDLVSLTMKIVNISTKLRLKNIQTNERYILEMK